MAVDDLEPHLQGISAIAVENEAQVCRHSAFPDFPEKAPFIKIIEESLNQTKEIIFQIVGKVTIYRSVRLDETGEDTATTADSAEPLTPSERQRFP
jgi:hypothetical protein